MNQVLATYSLVLLFAMGLIAPSSTWAQERSTDLRQTASSSKSRSSRSNPMRVMPNPVEKKNLKLEPFPKIKEEDTIEDRLLMLKKRLDHLHRILYSQP